LQKLAQHHRRQLNCKVIGITGSNGKTTTKELLFTVLSKQYKTHATRGNLNNHIGVPLTLLEIDDEIEIAIIEMGASHQGDIQELVEIAEPEFGLITNIGKAHLEGMGGIEGVIKTKTELYDFIRNKNQVVFVNTMHKIFVNKANGISQFSYGESKENNIQGLFLSSDPYVKFKWKVAKDSINWEDIPEIKTQLIGKYNFENLLSAACIGSYFNVKADLINEALSEYTPKNNRSQVIETKENKLILDAYNANPSSLNEALESFNKMNHQNKLLILGQMNELGESTVEEHKKMVQLIEKMDFNKCIFIGMPYKIHVKPTSKTLFFKDTDEAIAHIKIDKPSKALILVKGSRSNKLEKIQEFIP
jgi:UDP-N-acetylmuramoyl-tripeptide--D-alanyl-D-alanine ligase